MLHLYSMEKEHSVEHVSHGSHVQQHGMQFPSIVNQGLKETTNQAIVHSSQSVEELISNSTRGG